MKAPKKVYLGATFTLGTTQFTVPVCASKGHAPALTDRATDVTCNLCGYIVLSTTGHSIFNKERQHAAER